MLWIIDEIHQKTLKVQMELFILLIKRLKHCRVRHRSLGISLLRQTLLYLWQIPIIRLLLPNNWYTEWSFYIVDQLLSRNVIDKIRAKKWSNKSSKSHTKSQKPLHFRLLHINLIYLHGCFELNNTHIDDSISKIAGRKTDVNDDE